MGMNALEQILMISSNKRSIDIKRQCVDAQTIAELNVTNLIIEDCTSGSWLEVGSAIASLDELQVLEMINCEGGSDICRTLQASQSLRSVRMGTLGILHQFSAIYRKTTFDISRTCGNSSSWRWVSLHSHID